MEIIPLKELTFNTSNIPEDTRPQWSATAGYALGITRQLNNKLYESLDIIDPLCEYIYDNSDLLNPDYTTTAIDGLAVADNTLVPCTQNTTVVYEKIDNLYYIYTGTTGNVNFVGLDFSASGSWSASSPYRHLVYNPEETPTKWDDLGYTNKYKCIDQSLSSQTVVTGDMEMSFITGKVDSLFLFNLSATSANIKVYEIGTETLITEQDISLLGKSRGTFYGFWFYDYNYKNRLSITFPLYFNVRIEIILTAFGGETKCGLVGSGATEYLGGTLYGVSAGIIDFSEKQVNSNGETFLEVGDFKDTNSLTIDVASGFTDDVTRRLTELRATPIVFRGTEIYEHTTIFGIYNKWETIISTPSITKLSLDLESLT